MHRPLIIAAFVAFAGNPAAAHTSGPIASYAFSETPEKGRYGNGLVLGDGAQGPHIPASSVPDVSNGVTVEVWMSPAKVAGYPKLVWRDGEQGSPYNLGLAFGNG